MRWRRIPVRRILVLRADLPIDVGRRLIGKHELAIDDFHARAERCAAARVADGEKQLAAGLEDVLKRITRFGQSTRRAPTRTSPVRPASLAGSTHGGQFRSAIGSIDLRQRGVARRRSDRRAPRARSISSTNAEQLADEAEVGCGLKPSKRVGHKSLAGATGASPRVLSFATGRLSGALARARGRPVLSRRGPRRALHHGLATVFDRGEDAMPDRRDPPPLARSTPRDEPCGTSGLGRVQTRPPLPLSGWARRTRCHPGPDRDPRP